MAATDPFTMKSRILQAIILLVIFVVAVVLFNNNGGTPVEDNSGYLPASP